MATVTDYVKEVQEASDRDWERKKYNPNNKPQYTIESGSKYNRIVVTSFGQRSVHCFVDMDGNIYKSASWKTPAKGIRGNINKEFKPLLGYDFYGFNPKFLK